MNEPDREQGEVQFGSREHLRALVEMQEVSPMMLVKANSPNVVSVGDEVEMRVKSSRFRYRVVMVHPWLRLQAEDGRLIDKYTPRDLVRPRPSEATDEPA